MENLSHEVITRIVWDADLNVIERVIHSYDGPWAECKGGASKAEQAAADSQRTDEMTLMRESLDRQIQQMTDVNKTIDPIIQSITKGQTPPVLQPLQSALTASYMNQIPQSFSNIRGAINNMLVSRGIVGGQSGAGGGQLAQQFGQLGAAQAGMQQQGATNTAMTMNQQELGLLQNALGLKMGIGGQFGANVGGFNQGAGQALGSGVSAAQNVDQAQTSWMGPVFGAFGSIGGGFGQGWGKAAGCWIARAIYGEDDPRSWFARERLWKRARRELKYALIMAAYLLFGVPIAALVKRSRRLTEIFRGVFDGFISRELHG